MTCPRRRRSSGSGHVDIGRAQSRHLSSDPLDDVDGGLGVGFEEDQGLGEVIQGELWVAFPNQGRQNPSRVDATL